jgi:hypothetical protein
MVGPFSRCQRGHSTVNGFFADRFFSLETILFQYSYSVKSFAMISSNVAYPEDLFTGVQSETRSDQYSGTRSRHRQLAWQDRLHFR